MSQKIAILGGGQLGRMLIQSAINWNIDLEILDPNPEAPCANLVERFVVGDLQDEEAVFQFAQNADVVSIEIEHVSVEALERLEQAGKKVYPQPQVLRIIQDKGLQKQFFAQHQIPSSPFILLEEKADLKAQQDFLPAFQKLRKGGYDGKGVQAIKNPTDFEKAFTAPSLLEQAVEVEKELSVIVARNASGDISCFPPVELVFDPRYNLVDYLLAPAQIPEAVSKAAEALAQRVAEAFEVVGLLAVEMFWAKDGQLLVNEVAPRPHNSGHHSIEANITSQFEQHLRCLLNFPLGDTRSRNLAAMLNLVGAEGHQGEAHYEGLEEALQMNGVYVHLYGKNITKPGRKMGHITVLGDKLDDLSTKIDRLKTLLSVVSKA